MVFSLMLFSLAVTPQAAPEQPLYPLIQLEEYLPPISVSDRLGAGYASAFVQAGGEDDLPITPPVVEITAHADMNPVSLSIAFAWVWITDGRERHPVWFARLRAVSRGRTIERFADSRQCPGVEQSLAQLNDLPLIDPRVPTLPNPATMSPGDYGGYLHDNTYRIRLRGLFAGGRYTDRLEITGGSSAPFAPIVAESLSRLLHCWTETPPPQR